MVVIILEVHKTQSVVVNLDKRLDKLQNGGITLTDELYVMKGMSIKYEGITLTDNFML